MSKHEIKPPNFLITPYVLIADKELTPLDRTVYSVIYWFTELKGDKCFAGNDVIANIACCSEGGVANCLVALEKRGYIERIFKTANKHSMRDEIIPLITYTKKPKEGLIKRLNHFNQMIKPTINQMIKPVSSFDEYTSNNTTKSSIITEQKEKQRDKEKQINFIAASVDDNTIALAVSGKENMSEGSLINELIDSFQHVNTRYDQFFKHKTQRDALQRLLKRISFSQLQKAISMLPDTNGQPFAPVITTPVELENKFSKLVSFVKREKIKANTPTGKQFINIHAK